MGAAPRRTDRPSLVDLPPGVVAPIWADLNPSATGRSPPPRIQLGSVRGGAAGVPERAVVSWENVPLYTPLSADYNKSVAPRSTPVHVRLSNARSQTASFQVQLWRHGAIDFVFNRTLTLGWDLWLSAVHFPPPAEQVVFTPGTSGDDPRHFDIAAPSAFRFATCAWGCWLRGAALTSTRVRWCMHSPHLVLRPAARQGAA